MRKRRAIARQRALAAQKAQALAANRIQAADGASNHASLAGGVFNDPRGIWTLKMPAGWTNRAGAVSGEVMFRIFTPDGRPMGYSALSPVNISPSAPLLTPKARRESLGNVSFADLRRTVIDKMMQSNGWIVNDYGHKIDGKRAFVVIAKTSSPNSAAPQPWTFFFVEVDGRIYSLATTAPAEFYDQANSGSEQLLASLKSLDNRPRVVASVAR
jgi:hypothetical protein